MVTTSPASLLPEGQEISEMTSTEAEEQEREAGRLHAGAATTGLTYQVSNK